MKYCLCFFSSLNFIWYVTLLTFLGPSKGCKEVQVYLLSNIMIRFLKKNKITLTWNSANGCGSRDYNLSSLQVLFYTWKPWQMKLTNEVFWKVLILEKYFLHHFTSQVLLNCCFKSPWKVNNIKSYFNKKN